MIVAQSRYDPFKHHRQSIRYADWDYRTPAYYFITICTHQRLQLFDDPTLKQVAEQQWAALPQHKKNRHIALDEWVVMPNHMHGLLWLKTWPESILAEPERKQGFTHAQAGSVGVIVGNYKSQVTRRINDLRGQAGVKVWLRGYWDRIVRTEDELNRIRQYIIDNPRRWAEDRENLDVMLERMTYHP